MPVGRKLGSSIVKGQVTRMEKRFHFRVSFHQQTLKAYLHGDGDSQPALSPYLQETAL